VLVNQIAVDLGVFGVDMDEALAELTDSAYIVNVLPNEM
jgi:hypothetical protein